MSTLTYKQAGVDIDAGDAFVEAIKPAAAATDRPGVMGGLGGFGAIFDPKATGYNDPLIVSATDGVGTKLLAAIETGLIDDIGQDLVAMCVNDLICQGAEPMFFLDYFATGKLAPDVAARVVQSIARACSASGCALSGGETAEMPQMYADGHFDLAGFAVGLVERDELLPRRDDIRPGDKIVGWTSNGVHSNGWSLIRKICEQHSEYALADLMAPTRLYVDQFKAHRGAVKGFAHITGGGLPGNVNRLLPESCDAVIDSSTWVKPAFFDWIVREGIVDEGEAFRTFNMGIGFVAVCDELPSDAIEIGKIVEADSETGAQVRIA